jgi:hypothetical protein
MDPASLVSAMVGAQLGDAQMAIAAKMLRMNADAQGAIVKVLEDAQQNLASLANVADGVGQTLNISA